jgi:biopolymer transport protein ExbD
MPHPPSTSHHSPLDRDMPNMTGVIVTAFLLVIFVVGVTRFNRPEPRASVVLPDVSPLRPISMPPGELVIDVTCAGEYLVAGEKLSEEELTALLRQAALKNPGTQTVLIRADTQADWVFGVRVIELCNDANITRYRVGVRQKGE